MHEQDKNQQEMEAMNSLIPLDKGEILAKHEIVSHSVVKNLVRDAIDAMKNTYSPYSHHHVGAALLTKNKKVYKGCNIENAAFTPTNCAERTAFFKAISEGETEFSAIAIVGGKEGILKDFCSPCGVCRQVLREFCKDDFPVYLAHKEGYKTLTLGDLLPYSFGEDSLK